MADAVQNAAVAVQQEEVGPVADGLQHQPALHPVAQLVQGLEAQSGHPLQGSLYNLQQPGPGHVLAQQHAEHGGLLRVLQGQGGQVEPGVGRVGRQQQAHIAHALGPQGQHHLVPAGLVDLVHPGPGQAGIQFMNHARQAQRV